MDLKLWITLFGLWITFYNHYKMRHQLQTIPLFQPALEREFLMLWQQCLQQLEQEVPDDEVNTWLRALPAVEKRHALYLLAPNTIVLQQVHEHYLPRILFHARILSGDNEFDVLLQIGSTPPKPIAKPVTPTLATATAPTCGFSPPTK